MRYIYQIYRIDIIAVYMIRNSVEFSFWRWKRFSYIKDSEVT